VVLVLLLRPHRPALVEHQHSLVPVEVAGIPALAHHRAPELRPETTAAEAEAEDMQPLRQTAQPVLLAS